MFNRPRLVGVYVHLPFCEVKCAYCDFYSLAARRIDKDFWSQYLRRLKEDLALQLQLLKADTAKPILASIFFGGGTPSKAPAHVIADVIAAVRRSFIRALRKLEITAEANPESLTPKLLRLWREAGVNRVSVGIQSLDAAVLSYLGRHYRTHDNHAVLARIRAAGFDNCNADFITGVPGQTVESTVRDLAFALHEGVTHLSLYQLTIEPGTLLKQRIEAGEYPGTSDEEQAQQMAAACDWLAAHGFERYEISNFARPGYTCLHNRIYWTYRPYLGLGVAAHSFSGRRRFLHPRSLEKYMVPGMPPAADRDATRRDALVGYLRIFQPFRPERMTRLYAAEERPGVLKILDRAVKRGWLKRQGGLLRLTSAGAEQSDSLLAELWNV